MRMTEILALSGSLRRASLNTAMLEAARLLAPGGMTISRYDGIGALPHFTPDLDQAIPDVVQAFRSRAARSDGLLIGCPEYAGGIPGAFTNALDWLVGCPDFNSRPVMLVNVAVRAVEAEAALRLVLKTMSAPVIETASVRIPVKNREATTASMLQDREITDPLRQALRDFRDALAG